MRLSEFHQPSTLACAHPRLRLLVVRLRQVTILVPLPFACGRLKNDRFLQAIELFPQGPWKAIADFVGNKTPRQVMSHGQKYRQKIARRQRGLHMRRSRRQKEAVRDAIGATEGKEPADGSQDEPDQSLTNYHHLIQECSIGCPDSPKDVCMAGTLLAHQWPSDPHEREIHSADCQFHQMDQVFDVHRTSQLAPLGQHAETTLAPPSVLPEESSLVNSSAASFDAIRSFSDLLRQQLDTPQEMIQELLECLVDLPTSAHGNATLS